MNRTCRMLIVLCAAMIAASPVAYAAAKRYPKAADRNIDLWPDAITNAINDVSGACPWEMVGHGVFDPKITVMKCRGVPYNPGQPDETGQCMFTIREKDGVKGKDGKKDQDFYMILTYSEEADYQMCQNFCETIKYACSHLLPGMTDY